MLQPYEGPATFVAEDTAYPVGRLRLRVRRTADIVETFGHRRRHVVGLQGLDLIVLDLLDMPELPVGGELRLDDGQALSALWTGVTFELRLNA
jgi:hypothetical protein